MLFIVSCDNCLHLHLYCAPRVQSSHDSREQTRLAPPRLSGDLAGHRGEVGRAWTCADRTPVWRGHRAPLPPCIPRSRWWPRGGAWAAAPPPYTVLSGQQSPGLGCLPAGEPGQTPGGEALPAGSSGSPGEEDMSGPALSRAGPSWTYRRAPRGGLFCKEAAAAGAQC